MCVYTRCALSSHSLQLVVVAAGLAGLTLLCYFAAVLLRLCVPGKKKQCVSPERQTRQNRKINCVIQKHTCMPPPQKKNICTYSHTNTLTHTHIHTYTKDTHTHTRTHARTHTCSFMKVTSSSQVQEEERSQESNKSDNLTECQAHLCPKTPGSQCISGINLPPHS